MANAMDESSPSENELTTRPPDESDLVAICRRLNELEARYIVVGGFAIIVAGYARATYDID